MQMTILEALMVLSSVLVLPVLAVITVSFFTGGLRDTERVKYQVLEDPDDVDYWSAGPRDSTPDTAPRGPLETAERTSRSGAGVREVSVDEA